MRDFQENSSIQVTIMNDRAQGGSADLSSPSTIELMQHRRILMTDEYGAATGVNETDRDGKGVRVRARYFMQIFDTKKGRSLQRDQQLNIQQPPQYYFAFDYKRTPKPKVTNKNEQQLSTFSRELGAGLRANSTYRLFPLGKNEVLVRFENLADAFDIVNEQSLAELDLAQEVNLTAFANELYMEVNGKRPPSVEIKETDLQGVHDLGKRFRWPAKETGEESLVQAIKRSVKEPPADSGFDRIFLGPQSLRTFRIKYQPEQKALVQQGAKSKHRTRITLKKIDSNSLIR